MSKELHTASLNVSGNTEAPIIVVTDAPTSGVYERSMVMGSGSMEMFLEAADEAGLGKNYFLFINPCPPIPSTAEGSKKREGEHMEQYREEFERTLRQYLPKARLILYLGAVAGRMVMDRQIKITKERGQLTSDSRYSGVSILGLYSPKHVLVRPENTEIFETDMQMLGRLKDADFDTSTITAQVQHYEWCTDIQDWLDEPPAALCVDIEHDGGHDNPDSEEDELTGNRWYDNPGLLTVQLSALEGYSRVLPMDAAYYPKVTWRAVARMKGQLKELLGNPEVQCTGHNFNTDKHVLANEDIEVACHQHDSMQLAFVVDDNMREKGEASCVRRWVSDLGGYSDAFDQKWDKGNMRAVPPEEMLPYAGGDSDAGLRLTKVLVEKALEDERNYLCYRSIQMPAIRTFYKMERVGLRIDREALEDLGTALAEEEKERYETLIEQVPNRVKRKYADGKGGLSFTRPDFVRDILFSREGFDLTPVVFTKGTRKLDPEYQVPSISTKEHLPFFDESEHALWVDEYIKYQKVRTLQKTYVGQEGGYYDKLVRGIPTQTWREHKGFWKYLDRDFRIHPSFFLHRTVTGRTSSAYPNSQNFPKRGKLAKAFRRIFIPTEGFVFIEADLSQAELRVAAWMAMERAMLRVYNTPNGDIHSLMASIIMGVPLAQFQEWKGSAASIPERYRAGAKHCKTLGELFDFKRFQAKAVNFGFLYGMGWRKFMAYAKTDYNITFNENEAKTIRRLFFQTFPGLEAWHAEMRAFVQEHGYVRALHGALRRLPNIFSPEEKIQQDCERQGINSPVQRFASDLGLLGLTRFARDVDWSRCRPLAFIHDANVAEAEEDAAEEYACALKFYMQSQPIEAWYGLRPPLPITSDVSIGYNLGEMQERGDLAAIAPSWFDAEVDLLLPV